MTTTSEKFVVYWLGYHLNPPPIQSLPVGIDVVNLFLLNLANSKTGTTLDYNYITSKGTSWSTILTQANAAQQNGVKVCVSIMCPDNVLTWNTINDPDTFAENVYNLVTGWGLDGIDIDPEIGSGTIAPNQGFVTVVQALSKYFGPASDKGLIMSFVSANLSFDETVLKPCASMFDYVMLMNYDLSAAEMIAEFEQYAAIVASQNLMFGIGGDPWKTTLPVTAAVAAWEPKSGNKGGMMEFDINEDDKYQAAKAIIKALSPQAVAAQS